MSEITRIAVDTSKSVFTIHVVGAGGHAKLRRNFNRKQMMQFFEKHAPVEVVLEACGAAHHWGRWLTSHGHTVRLLPPQYVTPFVKRGKNDRNDAEAIAVAASQPSIKAVPVKSAEAQAQAMPLSVQELLKKQRTQLVNALRGHASEFGLIGAKGNKGLATLRREIEAAEDKEVPAEAKEMLALLGAEIDSREEVLEQIETRLIKRYRADPVARRLAGIPGVGAIIAITALSRIDFAQFRSGRHLAAWLGLTPREHSTGGKQRLGGISRAGDERLRSLLVVGAMSVIRHAKEGKPSCSPWLLKLLERRPRMVAAVALANKMARTMWAMVTKGTEYRPHSATAAA